MLSGRAYLTPPLREPHPRTQHTLCHQGPVPPCLGMLAGPRDLARTGEGCLFHGPAEGPPPWAARPSRAQAAGPPPRYWVSL